MTILDQYEKRAPTGQNVIDIFKGEWSSEMPGGSGLHSTPGHAKLFEDARIEWAGTVLGGFANRTILELGPLEGAHTYMMSRRGAKEVVAVEGSSRAFLKCLCVKELFALTNTKFLFGDFVAHLEQNRRRFDLVIASGVLYHMMDPIKLLDLICAATDRVYLWTHYFDEAVQRNNPMFKKKFGQLESATHGDFTYQYSLQSYNDALKWAGFSGGPAETSRWLPKDVIVGFLQKRGFTDIRTNFLQPDHPNGPAFSIAAQR